MQPGVETRFDATLRHTPLSRDLTFGRRFFDRLTKAVESARFHGEPFQSDGVEYETAEAREARYRTLGARPGSRFLNIGVDNQVSWPRTKMLVQFDRHQFLP